MKRVNLTFAEWEEIGEQVKHLRAKLMGSNRKDMTKKARRKHPITKAIKYLDQMKDKLDDIIFIEHPEEPTQSKCNVFYGPNREERVL